MKKIDAVREIRDINSLKSIIYYKTATGVVE